MDLEERHWLVFRTLRMLPSPPKLQTPNAHSGKYELGWKALGQRRKLKKSIRASYSDGRLFSQRPGMSADPKPTAGNNGTQITVCGCN